MLFFLKKRDKHATEQRQSRDQQTLVEDLVKKRGQNRDNHEIFMRITFNRLKTSQMHQFKGKERAGRDTLFVLQK